MPTNQSKYKSTQNSFESKDLKLDTDNSENTSKTIIPVYLLNLQVLHVLILIYHKKKCLFAQL